MKFLLTAINAKYIHSNPAIYSLRAYVGQELQPYVELAEYTINQQMQDILADIYRRKPDVIGFSCYIWNWSMVQELLVELPKLFPEVDIWLGGPEVTYDAPEIMQQYPQLAGIMVGEGEATFRDLLEYYVEEDKWKQKQGEMLDVNAQKGIEMCMETSDAEVESNVLGKYCGFCEEAGATTKVKCLSEEQEKSLKREGLFKIPGLCLPIGYTPAREMMNMNEVPFLYENLGPFTNKIIYYESSRGCPYRCSYCLSSIDKKVRLRDISVVKRELQFFLDNRVKQVKFMDRTFNCSHDHAMAIWQYLYENDNGVTNFHFEISADILREDEIELLNKLRPGLAQLEIGVQSTNPKTLEAIKRVMNVEKLEQNVAAIQEGQNIHQHLDLIAGLPYEDYESFGRSFNRVYSMKPEQLQLGFLKVLKGSDMHTRAAEYGIHYLSRPPYEVLYTNWLTYEEVLKLKAIEEMVELYYNSNQFTHTLPFLERAFQTPFAMYEAMAQFYEEKGYFTNSPARAYRYHVLLAFALEYDADNAVIYKELLTYDMYLRENLKSRPDFAMDMTRLSIKEYIRDFYQKEAHERTYLPTYIQYDWKQLSKMTHLEPFHYSVWDLQALLAQIQAEKKQAQERTQKSVLGEAQEGSKGQKYQKEEIINYILFDYQNRNPLTYEAGIQVIRS